MIQDNEDRRGTRPAMGDMPEGRREDLQDLFDTWDAVRSHDSKLTTYYEMRNSIKNLGVSVPPQLTDVDEVAGWAQKAVEVRVARSRWDRFVFAGEGDPALDALCDENGMAQLVAQATRAMLVHGVAAMSVMRGTGRQPRAMVRAYSANQCCMLWDKDERDIRCGVVLAGVDRHGLPSRYVAHFPDVVLDIRRGDEGWTCKEVENQLGELLMVPLVHQAGLDKPLGRSVITPELITIIDKAGRDILRMDIGAEYFTFPQRYILGIARDLLEADAPGADADGGGDGEGADADAPRPIDPSKKLQMRLGSLLAITRDENGDVPQVGQFPAGDAANFIAVYENDAQRFSGASHVPLAQLGVLSNNYTSSDALGAANDPLILDVEAINDELRGPLARVARLMMAINAGTTTDRLTDVQRAVRVHFKDPSMPTLAARADAWTKFAGTDKSIVGTRVFYEGIGLDEETIDRLLAEVRQASALESLSQIADALAAQPAEGQV